LRGQEKKKELKLYVWDEKEGRTHGDSKSSRGLFRATRKDLTMTMFLYYRNIYLSVQVTDSLK